MYSSSQGCHTATGTHMPHGITQCYLPPGRGDIPAINPAEAGTRLSDPGGMQGWVDLRKVHKVQNRTGSRRQAGQKKHTSTPVRTEKRTGRKRNASAAHKIGGGGIDITSINQFTKSKKTATYLFKHRRQRAEATYRPVKSVQWTYMHDKQ